MYNDYSESEHENLAQRTQNNLDSDSKLSHELILEVESRMATLKNPKESIKKVLKTRIKDIGTLSPESRSQLVLCLVNTGLFDEIAATNLISGIEG